MIEVILDASYVVALVDEKDRWHQQAVNLHGELKLLEARLVYLDCVMNETLSVIAKRLELRGESETFSAVLSTIQQLAPLEQITWVYPEIKQWYTSLLALMETHQGRLNFHDALIVLAATEMRIQRIVSFDADFDEVEGVQRIKTASDLQPEDTLEPGDVS